MNIGIDLDGVVFDSEKELKVYSELYDILTLKRNSVKDRKKLMFQERFNWTEDEIDDFLKKYDAVVTKESNFMPGAKQVLNLLKEEGHKLIVITARGNNSPEEITITKQVLSENNMDIFDKYYFSAHNKAEICKNENIDLMIDDSKKNCIKVSAENIKVVYFKDSLSEELEENEYIKVLYHWGEVYRYIKELENK